MEPGWDEVALWEDWLTVDSGSELGGFAAAEARQNIPAIVAYGEDQGGAEWGGVYLNWEGPVAAVACFTGELARHEAALRARVPHPGLLVVRHVERSEEDLAIALAVVERILGATPVPWTAAVRWDTDNFVVRVRLQREQVATAARLQQRFGDLVRVELCL